MELTDWFPPASRCITAVDGTRVLLPSQAPAWSAAVAVPMHAPSITPEQFAAMSKSSAAQSDSETETVD